MIYLPFTNFSMFSKQSAKITLPQERERGRVILLIGFILCILFGIQGQDINV
jgi:hypothetical protein